ncbi:MAG TPA: hypothetical protein VJZ94_00035, partial [Candidatus Paceibacterota bacterium]|nr:hypothetical protein [Candidatus Paceibacterota bacterium]
MDKILKNKKFISVKEIHFTPEFKRGLRNIFGDNKAKRAEELSKKTAGFQFTYLSGKNKVFGLLSVPISRAGKKLPCIIYNRGGYKDFGILKQGALFNNMGRFSALGYVVIAS